jgi:hypothetical protein
LELKFPLEFWVNLQKTVHERNLVLLQNLLRHLESVPVKSPRLQNRENVPPLNPLLHHGSVLLQNLLLRPGNALLRQNPDLELLIQQKKF